MEQTYGDADLACHGKQCHSPLTLTELMLCADTPKVSYHLTGISAIVKCSPLMHGHLCQCREAGHQWIYVHSRITDLKISAINKTEILF